MVCAPEGVTSIYATTSMSWSSMRALLRAGRVHDPWPGISKISASGLPAAWGPQSRRSALMSHSRPRGARLLGRHCSYGAETPPLGVKQLRRSCYGSAPQPSISRGCDASPSTGPALHAEGTKLEFRSRSSSEHSAGAPMIAFAERPCGIALSLRRPGDRGDLRGARDRIRPRAIAHGTWVWLPRHFPNHEARAVLPPPCAGDDAAALGAEQPSRAGAERGPRGRSRTEPATPARPCRARPDAAGITRQSPNAGPARQRARTPACLCRVASPAPARRSRRSPPQLDPW